jgi:pre-mRNA-processing factor SLU7
MSSSVPSHTTESLLDRKQQATLAEARQSGAVAPAVDVKTGSIINPHNPEFLTKRPWYLSGQDDGPSLSHQQQHNLVDVEGTDSLLVQEQLLHDQRRKQKEAFQQNKFAIGQWVEARKRNKGSYVMCKITHLATKHDKQEFDLEFEDGTVERRVPLSRVQMTKTGSRAHVQGATTYDGKRDAYLGYDNDSHNQRLALKYQARDGMRQELRNKQQPDKNAALLSSSNRQEQQQQQSDSDYDSDDNDSDSNDEFVQRDEDARVLTTRLARQGGVGGAQMKVTARNLRIREDTAKYLRNLDPNSAYYDPKSRSMRDNPNPQVDARESEFAGDNFARISGDAVALAETQLFAWDAAQKTGAEEELHPQANPSQAELLRREFKTQQTDVRVKRKQKVLDKYGGQEYLDGNDGLGSACAVNRADNAKAATDRKLRFGVSTMTEEYSRDGRLIKGGSGGTGGEAKLRPIETKYEEDVFTNGHSTVWGSYFHKGAFQWGYADDHSMMKNSYCTGETGRLVNDEANEMQYGTGKAGTAALAQARGMLKAIPKIDAAKSHSTATTIEPIIRSNFIQDKGNRINGMDRERMNEVLVTFQEQEKKRKFHTYHADVN